MKRRTFIIGTTALLAGAGAGTAYWPRRWNYIVIHHSAGNYGDIKFLQQVHRERQSGDPVDAIPYHYVIGNGNGLAMGEIASDWRREYDIWGAHVSGNNSDRNFRGIGVCLIGNLEEHQVPQGQYDALVKLTRSLMAQYDIPVSNVTGHGYVEGESTKCPGKHFPMEKFKRDIA
ncbi:MAG: peptidoglycan recognition protein family protein [Chromatiales bacterium]|nr:peptidoglycan recognition protein family protein [Chromatiales bacterium]